MSEEDIVYNKEEIEDMKPAWEDDDNIGKYPSSLPFDLTLLTQKPFCDRTIFWPESSESASLLTSLIVVPLPKRSKLRTVEDQDDEELDGQTYENRLRDTYAATAPKAKWTKVYQDNQGWFSA